MIINCWIVVNSTCVMSREVIWMDWKLVKTKKLLIKTPYIQNRAGCEFCDNTMLKHL